MDRLHQVLLIVSTLVGSWLGMQAVHECGHVFGAWATGGEVKQVVLHPLTVSRTDLSKNPESLLVVWAGPLFGVAAPLVAWAIAASLSLPGSFVLRFFAGFCLIANGAYIGIGSFDRVGDCGEMLRHGSQLWQLWLFGGVTVPAGFFLWHRQGVHFGLGSGAKPVDRRVAYAALFASAVTVGWGFWIGGA